MYIPHQYRETDPATVREFLQAHAFGILVSEAHHRPWGTHTLLEYQQPEGEDPFLESHIARANPQWKSWREGQEVLCIFNGPHTYISSSWYEEEEVPTWDYIAVHVYGRLEFMKDEEVMPALERLVRKYESTSAQPLELSKLSAKTLAQVRGVVGFRVRITEVQAAFKLSQGRKADHAAILRSLEERGKPEDRAIAAAIRRSEGMQPGE